MKKKPITKLFAVMAVAASPAAANPAAANPAAQPDPWAVSAGPALIAEEGPARVDAAHAIAAILSIGFAALAGARDAPATTSPVASPPAAIVVARPRTTPSGAPACGNVASRAPRPIECTPPHAAPIAVARPRTTPSGAPACGNVASRAPRPLECTPPHAAPIVADSPAPAPNLADTPAPAPNLADTPARAPHVAAIPEGGAQ